MPEKEVISFFRKVQEDGSLKEKLARINTEWFEKMVELGQEAGFEFSTEELSRWINSQQAVAPKELDAFCDSCDCS